MSVNSNAKIFNVKDRTSFYPRRQFLKAGLASGSILLIPALTAGSAAAQSRTSFPGSAPIELVVPGGPGAGTDVVARVIAQGLSEYLSHPVVVKNQPGAAGIIGAQTVARAKPDGHTLLFAITGTHTVNQFLYPELSYNPKKDFAPISVVCKYNNVLVVRPDFEAKNLKDLIALIRANPGKFDYGVTQNGSSSHLAMELLKLEAKLDMQAIPYTGAAAAVSGFLGAQFPVFMDTVINILPHIRSGKAIALATTGAVRAPVLPDVATISESGFPSVIAIGWGGIMAPAGTPSAAITKLNAGVKAALGSSAFDSLKKAGLELQYTTPEEMAVFIEQESERWGKVVRDGKLKPA